MPSDWIKHVQKYSKEHNCSYKDAMSRAKASYKKQSGGKSMAGFKPARMNL